MNAVYIYDDRLLLSYKYNDVNDTVLLSDIKNSDFDNIWSTMAQYVFWDLAQKAGRAREFEVDSAATSREEIGNDVDFRTRHKLEAEGVWCGHHKARQVTRADYDYYD